MSAENKTERTTTPEGSDQGTIHAGFKYIIEVEVFDCCGDFQSRSIMPATIREAMDFVLECQSIIGDGNDFEETPPQPDYYRLDILDKNTGCLVKKYMYGWNKTKDNKDIS